MNELLLGCVGTLARGSLGLQCVCVCLSIHDTCAFVQPLPVRQDIWEGGKGSVSEGSGLAAGYNRDTLNSRFLRLTGAAQYACMRGRQRSRGEKRRRRGGWKRERERDNGSERGSDRAVETLVFTSVSPANGLIKGQEKVAPRVLIYTLLHLSTEGPANRPALSL